MSSGGRRRPNLGHRRRTAAQHPNPLCLPRPRFTRHVGEFAESHFERFDNGDGMWSLTEFSRMCVAMINHHGDEKFAKLIEGLAESLEGKLEERRAFWQSLAMRTDQIFLFVLPISYGAFLLIMFLAPEVVAPAPL